MTHNFDCNFFAGARPRAWYQTVLALLGALSLIAPASASDRERGGHLEEIVVVASKVPRPLWRVSSQVTTIHRDEIRFQQMRSLGQVARYQSGIEVENRGTRFGDSGLSIRGIGGNRVAMELDAVPLPRGFAIGEFASSTRSALDPSILERVEILRGPASALYGSDALGGVVALTSVDPAALLVGGRGTYFGGGTGHSGADDSVFGYGSIASSIDGHGLLASLSRRSGNELGNASQSGPRDRIGFDEVQSFGKWTTGVGERGRVRAVVDRHDREVRSDLRSVLGFGRQFANTAQLSGEDRQTRTRASIEYRTSVDSKLDLLSVMAFRQDTSTDQRTQDLRVDRSGLLDQRVERQFNFDHETWGFEAKLRRDFDAGESRHVLVAGAEYQRETIVEQRDGLLTDLETGLTTKVLPPGETLPTRDLPRSRVDEVGLYLQDEIEWRGLTLIPALRWDRFNLDASLDDLIANPARVTEMDTNQLTARLGAVGRIGNNSSWYAHYAEGFRAPPAEDVNLYLDYRGFVTVRALPNPDLVPETSIHTEVGVRHESNGLFLEAGVYRSRYNDFIESRVMTGVDPADGALLFQSRNITRATIEGFEGRLRQRFGAFVLEAGIHWARGEDDDTGQPINSVAPAKAVLGIHWREHAPLSASLMIRHFDRQSRTDFSNGEFFTPPAATVLDLLAKWEPSRWLSVNAGVYNLADRRYWRYGDVRILDVDDPRVVSLTRPGRNVGVTIHFSAP